MYQGTYTGDVEHLNRVEAEFGSQEGHGGEFKAVFEITNDPVQGQQYCEVVMWGGPQLEYTKLDNITDSQMPK